MINQTVNTEEIIQIFSTSARSFRTFDNNRFDGITKQY